MTDAYEVCAFIQLNFIKVNCFYLVDEMINLLNIYELIGTLIYRAMLMTSSTKEVPLL